jgi:hypothetical protein
MYVGYYLYLDLINLPSAMLPTGQTQQSLPLLSDKLLASNLEQ